MSAAVDLSAAEAEEAMRLVFIDPTRAQQAALRLRARARRARDAAAESAAERVLGLAAKQRNSLRSAAGHLRRAVAVADGAGLAVPAAEARMSLALIRALQGDTADAMRLGKAAGEVLRGLEAARLQMQLALIAQRAGRFDDATAGYAQALVVFRREGDRLWEAKLLNNRGVMHAYRGRPRTAEADLERAERLYTALGQELAVADVRWNRGFAAGRAGRVTDALNHLAAAEDHYERHRISRALILMDRCDVLLAAGLFTEAREVAARAVTELARRRMAADLAEARLLLAAAALACGDLDGARHAARHASRAFDRQGRAAWAAVARYVLLRAAWQGGQRGASLLAAATRNGVELQTAGWAVPAADAHLIAARVALGTGDVALATELLRQAGHSRRSGPPALRIRAWHATALLRAATGDIRGADAALRAGLRALDEHRLTLGATELRVRAAEHGLELVSTALAFAVAARGPAKVLDWAERGRARAQALPPVRPPADPQLVDDLAALRAVSFQREQALADGRDARPLARQQAALERSIRDRSRRVVSSGGARDARPMPGELADRLAGRALIDLVTVDGVLHAVVVAGRSTTLHRLGAVEEAVEEVRAVQFALRRLAAGYQGARLESLAYSAHRLDDLLLEPVRRTLGDRDLVVVPSGRLYGLPWPLLPSCRGRAVTVAPSVRTWLRAAASAAPSTTGPVVLVAGPDLPGADAEVAALAESYIDARRLFGAKATVAAVLAALDGAERAHVAAHGVFRADNPQFSALTMHDGPLTVYDVESLRRPPRLVVLPACESGVSAVHRGDEIMGFAAALLAHGTRSLIATVAPVPDASAKDLMLDLHTRLRAGASVAAALAAAQDAAAYDPAAASFICFGAD